MTLMTLADAAKTFLVKSVTFDVDSIVSIPPGEQRRIRAMTGIASFVLDLLQEA
jgi:hypothetical protein